MSFLDQPEKLNPNDRVAWEVVVKDEGALSAARVVATRENCTVQEAADFLVAANVIPAEDHPFSEDGSLTDSDDKEEQTPEGEGGGPAPELQSVQDPIGGNTDPSDPSELKEDPAYTLAPDVLNIADDSKEDLNESLQEETESQKLTE